MIVDADMTVLAIFDVDGTLSTRDSLPILVRRALRRRPRRAAALLVQAPLIAVDALRNTSRAKERVLTALLRGMREPDLVALSEEVVDRLTLSRDLVPVLEDHRRRGHEVWLASASIEPVIEALALRVTATGFVATQLAFDRGVCTGRYVGTNCKGHEKVRRLDEVLGEGWRSRAVAYGDSRADRPLLDAAASRRWVRRGVLQ